MPKKEAGDDVTERHNSEQEAYAALGELAVWVEALSEDADEAEVLNLSVALQDEIDSSAEPAWLASSYR